MTAELIKFCRRNYPELADVGDSILTRLFETYKDTTIVDRQDGEIRGFLVYQKWPGFVNVLMTCRIRDGVSDPAWLLNLYRVNFAGQTVAWFDEGKMEARFHKCLS